MINTDIFFKGLRACVASLHIYKYWETEKGKEK